MGRFYAVAGSPYSNDDAGVLGPWLSGLAESGESSPSAIVEAAEPVGSPGHDFFQWNDDKAAVSWREFQARKMVRSIVVIRKGGDGKLTEVRAFHSVVVAPSEGEPVERRYVTIEQVKASEILSEQVVEEARARLVAWAARYEQYRNQFAGFKEFEPVFELVGEDT